MARDFAKVYGFGCLGLVGVLVVAALLMQRSWAKCPPVLDTRLPGPGGELEAVTFHFECGFGRKGTANLSIMLPGQDPTDAGNLFVVMDSSAVDLVLGKGTPPRLEVAWQSATDISVRYPAGAKVVVRNASARGVRGHYEEINR